MNAPKREPGRGRAGCWAETGQLRPGGTDGGGAAAALAPAPARPPTTPPPPAGSTPLQSSARARARCRKVTNGTAACRACLCRCRAPLQPLPPTPACGRLATSAHPQASGSCATTSLRGWSRSMKSCRRSARSCTTTLPPRTRRAAALAQGAALAAAAAPCAAPNAPAPETSVRCRKPTTAAQSCAA